MAAYQRIGSRQLEATTLLPNVRPRLDTVTSLAERLRHVSEGPEDLDDLDEQEALQVRATSSDARSSSDARHRFRRASTTRQNAQGSRHEDDCADFSRADSCGSAALARNQSSADAFAFGAEERVPPQPSVFSAFAKTALVAGFTAGALALLRNPPAPVHDFVKTTRLNMTRTTVRYPESFADPRGYDELCDTRNAAFRFGNRANLDDANFHFVDYFSVAGLYNMVFECLKLSTAVLLQPVRPIPDADEFLPNEIYGRHMALRKCPYNHFVTLGSLVPHKVGAWSGPQAWAPTRDASQLIELVHQSLNEGRRPVGAEFSPYTAVDELLWGPHRIKLFAVKFNLPWPMRIAWTFFPIQIAQLIWDTVADSYLRQPNLPQVIMDPATWKAWVLLSFRQEVLLPVILRVFRIYISADNLKAFIRGDPEQEWLIYAFYILISIMALPQILVYLPAVSLTMAVSAIPIWCVCNVVGRLTQRTYWAYPYHKNTPSLPFVFPVIGVMAYAVNRVCFWLTADTYICTHSRAILIPVHNGKVTVDAPVINFVQSLIICAFGLITPLWLCGKFLPESIFNRSIGRYASVEYIYMQWLKHPLHDAQALRIDQDRYIEHKNEHFFKNRPHVNCSYCAHLKDTKKRGVREVPEEAVIYRGLGQPWEPACLNWFLKQAQQGNIGAIELKLAIDKMHQEQQPRDFKATLETAVDFAECMMRAETLRHLLMVHCVDEDFLLDGQFSLRCALALEQFLVRSGESPMARDDDTDQVIRSGGKLAVADTKVVPPTLTKPLQIFLKKEGFYSGAVDGRLGYRLVAAMQAWLEDEECMCAQWLRDEEGTLGTATILGLQYFLKSALKSLDDRQVVAVDCAFGQNTVHALQIFLVNCGATLGAIDEKWTRRTRRFMRWYLSIRGYSVGAKDRDEREELFAPAEETGEVTPSASVRCLQMWLRDEGFPVGVSGSGQDGVDGVWRPATTCALQQFLNSPRSQADATSKAIKVHGQLDFQTVRVLKEFLDHAGERCEQIDGNWDSSCRRAMQSFLQLQGYYAGMVDSTFESLSVKSLDAWLEAHGFRVESPPAAVPSEVGANLPRATVRALQRFLNSAKAFSYASFVDGRRNYRAPTTATGQTPGAGLVTPGVGAMASEARERLATDSSLDPAEFPPEWHRTNRREDSHVGACWALALFGGAKALSINAESSVRELEFEPGTVGKYLDWGYKVSNAREILKEASMMDNTVYNWWGTAELLRCLSDGAWLECAGSSGTEAAILALESLKSAGEASTEMLEAGIASLVGQLRDGNDGVVKVVSSAMGCIRERGILRPEAVDAVVIVLMRRLEDTVVRASACEALRGFPSEALAHVKTLMNRLDDKDGGSVQRAAEALGALWRVSILKPDDVERVTQQLAKRLGDEDWHIRHGACRGLGAFGTAATKHAKTIVELVNDEDGMVVGAAGASLRALWDSEAIGEELMDAAAKRLDGHLDGEDRFIVVGACEGLSSMGTAAKPYADHLLKKLCTKSADVDIIRAAADALLSLQKEGVVPLDYMYPVAASLAKSAEDFSSEWQARWGACVGLGALGSVALPYAQVLNSRLHDEDEQQIVITAARDALKKLRTISQLE